jgi:hypothetical protein
MVHALHLALILCSALCFLVALGLASLYLMGGRSHSANPGYKTALLYRDYKSRIAANRRRWWKPLLAALIGAGIIPIIVILDKCNNEPNPPPAQKLGDVLPNNFTTIITSVPLRAVESFNTDVASRFLFDHPIEGLRVEDDPLPDLHVLFAWDRLNTSRMSLRLQQWPTDSFALGAVPEPLNTSTVVFYALATHEAFITTRSSDDSAVAPPVCLDVMGGAPQGLPSLPLELTPFMMDLLLTQAVEVARAEDVSVASWQPLAQLCLDQQPPARVWQMYTALVCEADGVPQFVLTGQRVYRLSSFQTPAVEDGFIIDMKQMPPANASCVLDQESRMRSASTSSISSSSSSSNTPKPSNVDVPAAEVAAVQRTCLFLHDMGGSSSSASTSSFPSFWGNLDAASLTPQCSTRVFVHWDSTNQGWDSPALHQQVCEAAGAGSTPGGMVMRDLTIFSHGMGSLVFAGALATWACTVSIDDAPTFSWFAVQTPWAGSEVADAIIASPSFCDASAAVGEADAELFVSFAMPRPAFLELMRRMGVCTSAGTPSTALASMTSNYTSVSTGLNFAHVVAIARPLVRGALCGSTPAGMSLIWGRSLALQLLAPLLGLSDPAVSPSDGLVSLSSCQSIVSNATATFGPDYTDAFAVQKISHVEGSCAQGELPWTFGQRPCSWFAALQA